MGKAGGQAMVYLFPDRNVDNPSSQVDGMVNALKASNIHFSGGGGHLTYSKVWLDIEVLAWSGDKGSNQAFISGLIQGCKNNGLDCGVYTNQYNWGSIVGDWNGAADAGLDLWYAHYDGVEDCSDFQSFGGWSHAAKKQWRGDATVCGADVDLNVDC